MAVGCAAPSDSPAVSCLSICLPSLVPVAHSLPDVTACPTSRRPGFSRRRAGNLADVPVPTRSRPARSRPPSPRSPACGRACLPSLRGAVRGARRADGPGHRPSPSSVPVSTRRSSACRRAPAPRDACRTCSASPYGSPTCPTARSTCCTPPSAGTGARARCSPRRQAGAPGRTARCCRTGPTVSGSRWGCGRSSPAAPGADPQVAREAVRQEPLVFAVMEKRARVPWAPIGRLVVDLPMPDGAADDGPGGADPVTFDPIVNAHPRLRPVRALRRYGRRRTRDRVAAAPSRSRLALRRRPLR